MTTPITPLSGASTTIWVRSTVLELANRLIGLGVIPERGLDQAIGELEHCKAVGLRAINLAVFPSGKTYPTPEDDRFWARALDLDMPITIHVQIDRQRTDPVFKYPKEPP